MEKQEQNNSGFHSLNKKTSGMGGAIVVIFLLAILLGVGAGYVLAQKGIISGIASTSSSSQSGNTVQTGVIYGSNDTQTFKDTTEGKLQNGGIDGEGQYHLVRPGGDSQNVYLTSSLVDLSKFVGHKVKVWGQTQAAQHAGWLMDVGRLEVEQ